MKKLTCIGVLLLILLLIIATIFFVKLGDRTISIPKQEKNSLGDLAKAVDFSLKFPSSNSLEQVGDNIHYYVTTIPDPSNAAFSKPVITGYSISLSASTRKVEYRGTCLDREGGRWILFSKDNYTSIKEGEAIVYDEGITMYYSEYRPYPFNTDEINDEELLDSIFTIFYAYIDVDGIRYSVIYSDMNYSESLESECIELAIQYFKSLL